MTKLIQLPITLGQFYFDFKMSKKSNVYHTVKSPKAVKNHVGVSAEAKRIICAWVKIVTVLFKKVEQYFIDGAKGNSKMVMRLKVLGIERLVNFEHFEDNLGTLIGVGEGSLIQNVSL